MKLNTKKILVTGGCGFVGRHLVKRLAEDSRNEITVIDDLSTGVKMGDWPEHLRSEVDRVLYQDCIGYFEESDESFDTVFHLAAVVEGRMTIENNPLKVAKDLMIDAALFRWAVRTNPDKIVYFSSSAAYPVGLQTETHHVALAEEMLDVRRGVMGVADMSYGWAKLTGEYLSYLGVTRHGLKVAIYRPFSGYGEDQSDSYPFPAIIKRVLDARDGPIEVWGTGEQSRDFIYIEDCIDSIMQTYTKMHDASALNIGSGTRTTFNQLIETACNVLGRPFSVKPLVDKPVGVFARYCDPAKQISMGLENHTSLEEGIKIVADYLRKN